MPTPTPPAAPHAREEEVLGALDAERLAADLQALLRVPSVSGDERAVQERVAELATGLGLHAATTVDVMDELRADPAFPGVEVPRDEAVVVTATLAGSDPDAGRLCLNGHVDVVPVGTVPWQDDPWAGSRRGDRIVGRGAVDMKGGLVAALHAVGAVARTLGAAPAEVVVQCVPGEEDGGSGTFAALRRDAAFDGCVIPEPTELRLVCAQAGALTFTGRIRGRAAHAATRRDGISAIDRYLPVHRALAEHEAALNAAVDHPLMRALGLPYPILVGRLRAGEWSSTVPDLLEFEGRVGVRVGESIEEARAALETVVARADDGQGPPPEIAWSGGQFGSGEVDPAHPFVELVGTCAAAEVGAAPPAVGVPYGADMRQYTARGIPTVMFGPRGLDKAHAVDEDVSLADLVTVARALVRLLLRFRRSRSAGL